MGIWPLICHPLFKQKIKTKGLLSFSKTVFYFFKTKESKNTYLLIKKYKKIFLSFQITSFNYFFIYFFKMVLKNNYLNTTNDGIK